MIDEPVPTATVVGHPLAGIFCHRSCRDPITAELRDLRVPLGNRLEALRGRWKGFHSIRINDQWRVIFEWDAGNASAVQIVDNH